MRLRADFALGGVLAIFVAFIGLQAGKQLGRKRNPPRPAADTATAIDVRTAEGTLVRVVRSTLPPPPPHNYAEIAQALLDGRDVTYMDEILKARGDHVARWIDRTENPVTVFVSRHADAKDFWPDFPDLARDAFYTWSRAGLPIRFLFIQDSAAAEVHLRWVDHFEDKAVGKTFWARDPNWWIVGGDIEIALHSNTGQVFDREAVHAIVLHEVGHLIGLDHSSNTENIMAPRVHVTALSVTDLNTAHLVYRLPPGSVKDTTAR